MWYETLNMVDFLWLQIRWELKICCCCSAFKHDWNHVYRLSKEAVNFLASTADVNNAMQTRSVGNNLNPFIVIAIWKAEPFMLHRIICLIHHDNDRLSYG